MLFGRRSKHSISSRLSCKAHPFGRSGRMTTSEMR